MEKRMCINILKSQSFKIILAIFSFLSIQYSISAQTPADSLKTIWSNQKTEAINRFAAYEGYYQLLIASNPKAIVTSSDSHFQLAKKESSKKEMLLALGNKSEALSVSGQDKKAIGILKHAFKIAKKYDDSVGMASNQVNRGVIHYNLGDYKEAVRNYTEGLSVMENHKMEDRQAIILSNLGVIFFEIEDLELSLDYFKKSLALLKKTGNVDDSEYIWSYMSDVYFGMGKTEKALQYAKKTFNILQTKNNNIGLADCHFLLARIYSKKGDTEKAIQSIKKSIALSTVIGNDRNTNTYKIMYASLILDKNVVKATEIGEEALKKIKNDGRNSAKTDVYDLLYKCYKAQGKTKLSLEMLEKHGIYNESLQIERNKNDITREAIQADFASKLHKNQIKNDKLQADLKIKQLRRVFVIIIIALILFFLFFFYYRSRMISNRKQREELLQEIEALKTNSDKKTTTNSPIGFQLDRSKIEEALGRKINETDWKVLNILVDDPVIPNKEIAEKAFMSPDGIGSSLRRMYDFFEIKESKYKKISLLLEAIKISNNQVSI